MDAGLESESAQVASADSADVSDPNPAQAGASPRIVIAPELANDPRLAAVGFGALAAASASDAEARDAFLIGQSEGALDLRPPGEHARRGIQSVFPPDKEPSGRGGKSSGRNPLIRAFGKRPIEVLDLTAGLGGDAYRLARAGHRVRAFERAAPVFLLLASGWARAQARGSVPAEIAERLAFFHGDGRDALASDSTGSDRGIYIDPMYPPPKRRSAKPRRELQVLRALLGGQTDAEALVAFARTRAARVVVKRPHHASPLAAGASHQVETKLVRFDVYLDPSLVESSRDPSR